MTPRNLTKISAGYQCGKLTTVRLVERNRQGQIWLCKCECGNETRIDAWRLKNNKIKSCGCSQHNHLKTGCGVITGTFFGVLMNRARQANLTLSITPGYLNDLWNRQDGQCALTGIPLVIQPGRISTKTTASVDRIDNDYGYVPDNVHFVHKDINMMRGSLTIERFMELCALVTREN